MPPHLVDWLNLAVRWTHLIAGIAWIGSSFYFIWLDSHLESPSPSPTPGKADVEGELWMVHSGGFYLVERRRIGPGRMPRILHWFKWEAAITWVTGLALLALVYYLGGGVALVDPAVSGIGVGTAVGVAVGMLVVAWFGYDWLWRSPLADTPAAPAISLVLLGGAAYGLCHLLSGRAAFIHVGAMLGTLMVANVWLRILPAQQQMIDATREGREPDFTLGTRAKRRSVHNSYMTFPVLFIMLSNHYPATYAHPLNWLVLLLLIVVGAGARHVMIAQHGTGRWAVAPVAAVLGLLVVLTAPKGAARAAAGGVATSFAQVRVVVNQRCLPCHSAYPTDSVFRVAPAGVTFDTPESIRRMAERIRVRVVETRTMPFGNKTGMTDQERELVGRWIVGGAHLN